MFFFPFNHWHANDFFNLIIPKVTPSSLHILAYSYADNHCVSWLKFGDIIYIKRSRSIILSFFFPVDLVSAGNAQAYSDLMHVNFRTMLYAPKDSSLYVIAKGLVSIFFQLNTLSDSSPISSFSHFRATLVKLDGKSLVLSDAYTVPPLPQGSPTCQKAVRTFSFAFACHRPKHLCYACILLAWLQSTHGNQRALTDTAETLYFLLCSPLRGTLPWNYPTGLN